MGIRKNAKFLTAAEREDFAHACVMMRADIVNPTAAPADRYSVWEQNVALHRMIQNANTPTAIAVNFGHGGFGAYGFLAWHRYFLYRFERALQGYVPGVMLPYWDWTDPVGTIAVDDFLGPDGDPASTFEIRTGYFAKEAPGTGANTTPAPGWWPAALAGFTLHAAFGTWEGALRRQIGAPSGLPSVATLRSALDMTTYPLFQNALEGGSGTVPYHALHNRLHGWFGGPGHMMSIEVSPFDPMFYLHHCNIDRLWAMWQMDGHADEYPMSGGNSGHNRTDPMYPWVGTLGGYSSNLAFPPIALPDFSALGVVTAADVLDHRALGYSYDTQAVVGVALDRTGSMMGMTPDPMTTSAPDVTKWEAAKRGVSAFYQDCEAAYAAVETYVLSGVKTFRQLGTNDFAAVFAGTPYGLIKPAGGYSRTTFDAAVAPMTPGGGTPLADALVDVHATIVAPPFGWLPADERRYLAILTDGLLTAGSPLATIPDGSLAHTAVFAMGFGTGADVDYGTLAAMTAKGETLGTTQVFHGENAGTIDKFYSQALAAAIGFTPVIDPVIELHEGEHAHLHFGATSADDVLFLTAQGMDFDDDAWTFQLIGPDGGVAYTDGHLPAHAHGGAAHASASRPFATVRRSAGRLSLFLRRDNADDEAWVGTWEFLVAWRSRTLDAMVMLDPGDLMVPVSAGPVRGPRHARLLLTPERRKAARAVASAPRHRLDGRPTSSGRSDRQACSVVVNVYARTRLRMELEGGRDDDGLAVRVSTEVLRGSIANVRAFARLIAPVRDVARVVARMSGTRIPRTARLDGSDGLAFDAAMLLARLEASDPKLAHTRDEELPVVSHHHGALHVHVKDATVLGAYHVGMRLEGTYVAGGSGRPKGAHAGHGAPAAAGAGEWFMRILSVPLAMTKRPANEKAPKKVPDRVAAKRRPDAKGRRRRPHHR